MATSVRTVDSVHDLGVIVDSHLTMTTHVSAVCRAPYYQLRQLHPIIRLLSSDTAKLLVQAFFSTRLDYCNSLLYMISDELYRRLQAVQNASARLITNTRRCEHITPVLQQLHWLPVSQRVQFKIAVLVYEACVPGGRLPTCVCHSTPTTAFVGHRHVPSTADQHTSWRSLIRCCWTSRMEQSVNPAARVGHYTWTISTSTRNASIWSLTAAAPSGSVFRAPCINALTYCYFLTYSQRHTWRHPP